MKFTDGKLYWRIFGTTFHKGALNIFSWWDEPDKPAHETFNLILSTFRFLE